MTPDSNARIKSLREVKAPIELEKQSAELTRNNAKPQQEASAARQATRDAASSPADKKLAALQKTQAVAALKRASSNRCVPRLRLSSALLHKSAPTSAVACQTSRKNRRS